MKTFEIKRVKRKGMPPIIPVKVETLNDARQLLSNLIYALQVGTITGQTAKDLTYLLINYVSIFRETEMLERVQRLERLAL